VVCSLAGARERATIAVGLLGRVGTDGQGKDFQFFGWKARRYETWAAIVLTADTRATLVLPEWHPSRPVVFVARLLPLQARQPGAWLRLRADLSAPHAGRLNLSDLELCTDPGDQCCPRPVWTPSR